MGRYWKTSMQYSQISVGELQRKAQQSVNNAKSKGKELHPIVIEGRQIAKSWWGIAWCQNIEQYADYSSRLTRGKRYVKTGAVIDLQIVLSGIVGILCNLLLCVLKFICGTVSHSVSITADAANNLSDASSNIVTVIGAKIASKPVDNDHPFGHGRMEYISALIVDFFIFLMGFELGKSSIEKIIHPQEVRFSAVTVAVLVLSVGVKLWMAYFNQVLYKESNNLNLKAVRQDSLNDCISTAAAGAALLLSAFTAFDRADGIMGLLVAAFILAGGVSTLKDIMGPLLGQAPSTYDLRPGPDARV